MKITRITVYHLDLPLNEPYWLSGGRLKFETLDSTFVRIDTDGGLTGWGEGCPWGHTYLPAHGPGIRAGIETLAPALLGLDPRVLDHVNRVMDVQLPGHPYVKSPIDMACNDIAAHSAGLPLWQFLGGATPDPVPISSSISTGTPDYMLDLIAKARAKGMKTHSAKLGGSAPGVDIERMEAISSASPADENVVFDINRAWTPAVAIEVLNSVSARNPVEQPCETLGEIGQVARRVSNPIVLDECLHGPNDYFEAWKAGIGEAVKLKPNRVGGLTKARRIRDFGVTIGWRMHIEDVGGSVLTDTATAHLASSTPDAYRLAGWLSHDHLALDPAPGQGARLQPDGTVIPPGTPGIGVIPETDILGAPTAIYEA